MYIKAITASLPYILQPFVASSPPRSRDRCPVMDRFACSSPSRKAARVDENPLLRGACTQKRCEHCGMLLMDGRCLDCPEVQEPPRPSAQEPPPSCAQEPATPPAGRKRPAEDDVDRAELVALPEAPPEAAQQAPPPEAAPRAPPPAIEWSRSWYEILSVARTAHAASIKAAHRRLSALYHPDKAGAAHTATMQRINHIWAILSDPATRRAYNKNPHDFPFPGSTWRADADAPEDAAADPGPENATDPPDPSARGDASKEEPELDQSFTLRWEPVNVAAVEKALMLAAVRSVRMEHYDCFEILLSIRKRAV